MSPASRPRAACGSRWRRCPSPALRVGPDTAAGLARLGPAPHRRSVGGCRARGWHGAFGRDLVRRLDQALGVRAGTDLARRCAAAVRHAPHPARAHRAGRPTSSPVLDRLFFFSCHRSAKKLCGARRLPVARRLKDSEWSAPKAGRKKIGDRPRPAPRPTGPTSLRRCLRAEAGRGRGRVRLRRAAAGWQPVTRTPARHRPQRRLGRRPAEAPARSAARPQAWSYLSRDGIGARVGLERDHPRACRDRTAIIPRKDLGHRRPRPTRAPRPRLAPADAAAPPERCSGPPHLRPTTPRPPHSPLGAARLFETAGAHGPERIAPGMVLGRSQLALGRARLLARRGTTGARLWLFYAHGAPGLRAGGSRSCRSSA